MSRLISLDPGTSRQGSCAAALFSDGELREAKIFQQLTRVVLHPVQIARMFANEAERIWGGVDELALEWPVVRRAKQQKGDQADILALAGVCGAFAGVFDCRVAAYRPEDWKGQIPKPKKGETYIIETRVIAALSPSERDTLYKLVAVYGARFHNVVDAIGIGLYHLGRLHQTKSFYRG